MKIYSVNASHYHYWKDAYNSGFVTERYFFISEENAKKFIAEGEANPYEVDFHNNKVPVEADYKKPSFTMGIIETED